jgi:hypothetical protein
MVINLLLILILLEYNLFLFLVIFINKDTLYDYIYKQKILFLSIIIMLRYYLFFFFNFFYDLYKLEYIILLSFYYLINK